METNPYEPPSAESQPAVQEDRPTEDGAVLFGVAIRTLGVVSVGYGGWYLGSAIVLANLEVTQQPGDTYFSLLAGLYYVFGGLALLGLAPVLVRLNYYVRRKSQE